MIIGDWSNVALIIIIIKIRKRLLQKDSKNSKKIITKRFEKFKKDDYKKNQKIAPKNDLKNNLKMSGF